jgi:spore germination cell wall hydrolase CwlJ-like protein
MKKIKKIFTVAILTVITTVLLVVTIDNFKIFNTVEIFRIPEQKVVVEIATIKIDEIEKLPIEPQLLYRVSKKQTITARDRECLLKNIFYESGAEPIEGKIAVAQVTFNRLEKGRWGDTICKVVYAKQQFSWTLDSKKRHGNPSGPLWEESKLALDQYLSGARVIKLDRGTHFHASWMNSKPQWAYQKVKLTQIGQHVFYASLN